MNFQDKNIPEAKNILFLTHRRQLFFCTTEHSSSLAILSGGLLEETKKSRTLLTQGERDLQESHAGRLKGIRICYARAGPSVALFQLYFQVHRIVIRGMEIQIQCFHTDRLHIGGEDIAVDDVVLCQRALGIVRLVQ